MGHSSLVRHEAAMAISSPQISTHFLDRVDEVRFLPHLLL